MDQRLLQHCMNSCCSDCHTIYGKLDQRFGYERNTICSLLVIHLKAHVHATQDDMCREANKVLVEREVFHTPNKKNFAIDLFVNVSFMLQYIFNEDDPMA